LRRDEKININAPSRIVGVTLLVFGFTNSLGVASVVPIISSEISSVRLRSKSAGIGFTVQALGAWLFSFFTPYLYNADEANWGGKIGFFMSGLSLIGFIVIWLEVPETKGRTFLEIDYLFREGTRNRAFCTTLVPDTEITVDDLKGGNGTKEF
jgi:SP family general alpha glucoside:H+ symporter-like MFS transporter